MTECLQYQGTFSSSVPPARGIPLIQKDSDLNLLFFSCFLCTGLSRYHQSYSTLELGTFKTFSSVNIDWCVFSSLPFPKRLVMWHKSFPSSVVRMKKTILLGSCQPFKQHQRLLQWSSIRLPLSKSPSGVSISPLLVFHPRSLTLLVCSQTGNYLFLCLMGNVLTSS